MARSRISRGQGVAGWLFVSPALAILLIFMVVPIILALYVSFTQWDGLTNPLAGGAKWVGLSNYAELITWLKANKDKVNLANAGLGSASHLCGMLLQSALKMEMTTVPYKGTNPAMTDLLGGQVDIMCDQTTNTSGQIEANSIKAYGVTTTKRLTTPALAKLPTLDEAGLKGFNVTIWQVATAYGTILMESGHASLLAFTTPLWVALMNATIFREKLNARLIIAIALGIAGIFVLMSRDLDHLGTAPLGAACVLTAAIGWAIGTIYQKRQKWTISVPATKLCWTAPFSSSERPSDTMTPHSAAGGWIPRPRNETAAKSAKAVPNP